MTTERAFRTTDALTFGWETTKKHFVSLFLGLGVLTLLLSALEGSAEREGHGLLHVALELAGVIVTMGWWRIALRVHDGKPAALAALGEVAVAGFLHYLLTIIFFWVVVVSGLVLLVVPGVYAAARLCLAPAVAIDEGLEPVAALRRSFELTEGRVAEMVVLGLALGAINLLGALLFGLGLLGSIPTSFLATVYVFRCLAAAPRPPREPHAGLPTPTPA